MSEGHRIGPCGVMAGFQEEVALQKGPKEGQDVMEG